MGYGPLTTQSVYCHEIRVNSRPDLPSTANVSPNLAIGTDDVEIGVWMVDDTSTVTGNATVSLKSGSTVEVQPTAARHAAKNRGKALTMVTL